MDQLDGRERQSKLTECNDQVWKKDDIYLNKYYILFLVSSYQRTAGDNHSTRTGAFR